MCPLATALVEFADQQETITHEITHHPRCHLWGRILPTTLVAIGGEEFFAENWFTGSGA